MEGEESAAHALAGRILESGWHVVRRIPKGQHATGAFFSVCYEVVRDGETCFLKAFDFDKFFRIAGPERKIVDVISQMLDAYKYERDLSNLCRNNRVTKVLFVKDAGEEVVDGYAISTVPYLIFDMADGDVRTQLNIAEKLDFAWRLNSLHDIAVGLKQLHWIEVSHQDLKPSNILLFNGESKIGDLGRSICTKLRSPYEELAFTGDLNYAPPEIMYACYEQDWHKRVFATDCYLLGSMVVFYFSGVSMSALLLKHLPSALRWERWRGPFDQVKPYLLEAFARALDEFETSIEDAYFRAELRWLVERLSFPLPQERGHPKNLATKWTQYHMERFISKLDLLHKRARYRLVH